MADRTGMPDAVTSATATTAAAAALRVQDPAIRIGPPVPPHVFEARALDDCLAQRMQRFHGAYDG